MSNPQGSQDDLEPLDSEQLRWREKLNDPTLRHAYLLFLAAWEIAVSGSGDAGDAIAKMEEAASLDPEYRSQVGELRGVLERKASSGAGERLRALEARRSKGDISDEEFVREQGEIFRELDL